MNFPFKVERVSYDGGSIQVTVARGYVNWKEPKVGGKFIGGVSDTGKVGPQPIIAGDLSFDEYNRCYVSLKVKVDDDGTMPQDPGEDYLTVVISKGRTWGSEGAKHDYGPGYWLHPIATINKEGVVFQNVHFNLLHWVGINAGITNQYAAFNRAKDNSLKFDHYFTSV